MSSGFVVTKADGSLEGLGRRVLGPAACRTFHHHERRQRYREGIRGSRRAPPYGAGQHGRRSNRAVFRHTKRAPAENRRPGPCAKREPQYRTFFIFLLHQCRRIMAIYKFVSWFSWQSRASKLYSNSSTTISGFDPSRSGGPHVPAPLEVKTCIFPIRLKPYTNRR